MKFGVAFLQKTENSPCRVVLLCEKCRKAVFFSFSFIPHPADDAAHIIITPPSSFIHPTCSASSWTPSSRSGPLLSVRWGFLLRVSRPSRRRGFFCLPRPEFTRGHSWSHWHACFPDISFSPHSCREGGHHLLTWIQFSVKSNSASPLNPMRQNAETEAETHWWRSSCTLDRRHGCCRCHTVFAHDLIMWHNNI